jgi:hypothetical protein
VVAAGRDRPAGADAEPAVVRVGQRPGDIDVDATDRVDHRHEAGEVDLRVVVDRDAEQRPDRVLERPRAALREVGLVAVRVAEQRVDLRRERVAVAERDVDEVARDRQHRRRLADGVDRDDDQRVGQGVGPVRARVDAHQQDVDPLAGQWRRAGGRARIVLGTADGLAGRAGEDAPERRRRGRAVGVTDQVGQPDEGDHDDEADPAEPAGSAGVAAVAERLEDGDQPPAEQDPVEDQQRLERRRDDRPGDQHRRRVVLEQQPRGDDEDQRRHREHEGRSRATVEGLAETGEDGRQDGSGETALVGRPGVDDGDAAGVPDGAGVAGVAGVHDGWVEAPGGGDATGRRPRGSLANDGSMLLPPTHGGRNVVTPGGRSACQ